MAKVRKRTWTSGGDTKTAWVADYFDQGGKRHIKTFERRKDADSWLATTVVDVREGRHTAERSSITVSEACELWLQRGQREKLERGTLRNYSLYVKRIVQHIGGIKLAQLTKPMVKKFGDTLLDTGVPRQTARAILAALKGILREAEVSGLVAQNTALGITISSKTREKRKLEIGKDVPSKAEINQLITATKGRWRPLIVTAAFTGMRASELRGLTWPDVDFAKKVVHVRQRANIWQELGAPKSEAGKRAVPMSPMVLNVLREWKLACPNSLLGLVFPTAGGTIENHSNLLNRFWWPLQVSLGVVDEAGEAKYGLHALRHFYASHLIDLGFAPKKIQTWLGHSSITMTFDRYGHLFPSLEDDHAKLAAGELSIVGGG
jgi:integrase